VRNEKVPPGRGKISHFLKMQNGSVLSFELTKLFECGFFRFERLIRVQGNKELAHGYIE
jgi:hypothetical protein